MQTEITLESDRVKLVPLSLEQLDDLLEFSRDASLWEQWTERPPDNREEMRRYIENGIAAKQAGKRVPFAIYIKADDKYVGSTSYLDPDAVHKTVEIGHTWLATKYHGSGVNREMKELLLEHAFNALSVNRVMLETDATNMRSRRAIEKLGAHFEGILRNVKVVWNGRLRSSAIYSILKEEWK